ncbi:SPARC-related modular calcium-binding protein 2 isoform X2 [Athalia rosae]|uniref:SPARC-related modular calcium-binding protein 2 isoform X2 n=1 Tax=Athalia rosae TaxID=37344 RepID=UPI00203326F1|nr:SPARC-related modular calcium-binding protein 2 isoform X2 [Athalia rosae]
MLPRKRPSTFTLILLFFALIVVNTSIAVTTAKEDCKRRLAECTMSGRAGVAVCGSDDVTYPDQCKFISKQCEGAPLLIKHTGPCSPETQPCFTARLSARPGARPMCRSDGTYAQVQCHVETGYCWCVTGQGRPIPDTSVRHQRPRCPRIVPGVGGSASTRSAQRRRSPAASKNHKQFNNRHRNTCDRAEKTKFNNNLIDNFKIEYRRTNISADGDKNVERVLSWKFMTLDKDTDGFLDRDEYRELRRLARKAVRPKKCARTFARTCDLNRDLKLSRQEWGACLALDFTLRLFLSLNPGADERAEVPEAQRTRATDQVLIGNQGTHRPTFIEETADPKEETEANDCISDRKSVLEDQKQNAESKFYVPQCTPDGRYSKVQCYSGYCWCVYQDSGKPIPGTSVKDGSPNCNPVPEPNRPMKGCPDLKKQAFLKDLMDLMQKKMKASSTESDETTLKWQTSNEERIATWHFVMLDRNKNKVLERKEWKSFRTMVANNRQLRRCGKKLPRYCDVNNDRKISMTEWLNCLNAQRIMPADSPTKTPAEKIKRKGPNPIDQILIAD